ncbi:MAG: hydroxyquinol 1,2-dioxygenase [Ilumatobacteraceae bacterium]
MTIIETAPNASGYKAFTVGSFTFSRDEYFATITWPTGMHQIAVDVFLRALQRDIAWGFFYGIVNFDAVFGTMNHYGNVDMFAGRFNDAYRRAEVDFNENFDHDDLLGSFQAIISDWTNEGYDPFAAPMETGQPFGPSRGNNDAAVTRRRVVAERMVGVPGDEQIRTDESGFTVNRQFEDVPQDEPVVEAEPGYEGQVCAYNMYAYISRSDVTWNPSVVSACKESLYCPPSEEFILPVIHGNDRVEWFVQLSDEIQWDVEDRDTGAKRARVICKAGDVSAMPADIRHQGYSPKRSMLLVWENASNRIPEMIASGEISVRPVEF